MIESVNTADVIKTGYSLTNMVDASVDGKISINIFKTNSWN